MIDLLVFGIAPVLGAVALAWWICDRRPGWGIVRVALLAASPLPLLVLALCSVLFVTAWITPPARCGTDGCGMAMGMSLIAGGYAIGAYLLATIAAGVFAHLRRMP